MVLLLPIALLLMTAVSIAFVAGTSRLFNPYVAALVFLLFALSGEQPFSHEVFYAALLIHVWCLYLYMKGSLFWTSFFVSCASLLYPPLICFFPLLAAALLFLENGDIARNFVKITGGFFLPYLYILVFMFLFTDSVTEYLWDVWYGISEIGLPRLAYSLPEIALAICTTFVLLHIFATVFKNFIEHSDRMLLRISGAVLLFAFIVFILFSERELFEARLFFATAFSLMFSFHYKNIRRGSANAELVLLAILSLITAAGRFLI